MTVKLSDSEILDRIDGMYTGLLSDEEFTVFEAAIKRGEAARDYCHVGGLFGLTKVRVIRDYGNVLKGGESSYSEDETK